MRYGGHTQGVRTAKDGRDETGIGGDGHGNVNVFISAMRKALIALLSKSRTRKLLANKVAVPGAVHSRDPFQGHGGGLDDKVIDGRLPPSLLRLILINDVVRGGQGGAQFHQLIRIHLSGEVIVRNALLGGLQSRGNHLSDARERNVLVAELSRVRR